MTNTVTVIGIAFGKNWFHVVGLDHGGKPVLRRKLGRLQLAQWAVQLPTCRVAMESCPGSQYWGRRFAALGHDVRIIPAQFDGIGSRRPVRMTGEH
jgi:transposase